jgi:hypothetical protein
MNEVSVESNCANLDLKIISFRRLFWEIFDTSCRTAYPSGAPEFTSGLGGFVLLDLQFYVYVL